ncbi:hypothetical protein HY546_00475 [archaeon]|nr:hypothetical protein [archaeon]
MELFGQLEEEGCPQPQPSGPTADCGDPADPSGPSPEPAPAPAPGGCPHNQQRGPITGGPDGPFLSEGVPDGFPGPMPVPLVVGNAAGNGSAPDGGDSYPPAPYCP